MGEPETLSEADLAIVHALQVAPRASWQRIGAVVGLDPATVARRWARLEERRLAWLTIWPAPGSLASEFDAALVCLACEPGSAGDVASAAGDLTWVATVDVTAGSYDVVVLVVARGLLALQDRIQDVACLSGVRRHTARVLAAVHADDTQWQLRVLSRHQRHELVTSGKPPPVAPRPPSPRVLAALIEELKDDVRRPLQQVAVRMGTSEASARRALDRAVASGVLHLGCDLSGGQTGEGRLALLDVDTEARHADAPRIAAHPAVRRCYDVVSSGSVHVAVRLRSLADLARIEGELAEGVSGWSVRDRVTVMSSVKRNGHLLDEDGQMLRRATTFA